MSAPPRHSSPHRQRSISVPPSFVSSPFHPPRPSLISIPIPCLLDPATSPSYSCLPLLLLAPDAGPGSALEHFSWPSYTPNSQVRQVLTKCRASPPRDSTSHVSSAVTTRSRTRSSGGDDLELPHLTSLPHLLPSISTSSHLSPLFTFSPPIFSIVPTTPILSTLF